MNLHEARLYARNVVDRGAAYRQIVLSGPECQALLVLVRATKSMDQEEET